MNLGLKTSYKDFYPYFLKNAKDDNYIKSWINLEDDKKLWSDLELALGQHMDMLKNEQLDKFFDDKDELVKLLSQYLQDQEDMFQGEVDKDIGLEFLRSILEFDKGIPIVFSQKINNIKSKYKNEQFCYQFLTLNYTRVLEKIRDTFQSKDISEHSTDSGTSKKDIIDKLLHVHGSLDSDMILTVNDESQLNNPALCNDIYLKSSMIKPLLNEGNGHNRTRIAYDIIDGSHIIIAYGVSFGETDNLWWQYIIKWLKSNIDNTLIIYQYLDDREDLNVLSAKKNREMIKVKHKLLEKDEGMNAKAIESLSKQIVVIFEPNIFLFGR